MEKILFATGNSGKVKELKPLFRERGFDLQQVEVDVEEVQAVEARKVARHKLLDSRDELGGNGILIVDDTGFFVNALDGFPGSLAFFLSETVGVDGLLPLLEGEDDRSAYFETAISVYTGGDIETFTGRLNGKVPEQKRGEAHPHLPYESYFIPEGENESFAEKPSLKQDRSHRKEAAEKLLEWLESR